MKTALLRLNVAAVAACLLATQSQAQDEIPPNTRPDLATPAIALPQPTNSSSNPLPTPSSLSAWGKPRLVTTLIGSNIKSSTGESIGQIQDLLVDENGQIRLAVLGIGGFLGIGEKRTPVPWQAVDTASAAELTLRIDRQKLKSGPAIDKSQTTAAWATPDFLTEVFAHYGSLDNGGAVGGTGTPDIGTDSGKDAKSAAKDLKEQIKEKSRELKEDLKRGTENLKERLQDK